MLDLDHLANERAKVLKQPQDKWVEAVWSPQFQKISAELSDGEVIDAIAKSASAQDLVEWAKAQLDAAP